jgi:predicted Rossmann fold nucleotide-binding protein DprA/Smf involved in DNA uptake
VANYSEVIYWLALVNESGLKLNLIKPLIQNWCLDQKRPLSRLFELSALELAATFGLPERDAERILKSGHKLADQAKTVAEWQAQGIEVIIRTDPRYPRRLVHSLPLVKQPLFLWTQGAAQLFNQPGVTMLGRREPSEAIAAFVQELMQTLEAEEIGLISGYDRGLDRVTFDMMLATEQGYTTAILPLGLSAFAKTTSRLTHAVATGRTLLVSPFSPETPFNEKLAEARNLLIDHLTLALLIPESDEESQVRATAALERGLPVFVKANTPENRALLEQGALLLTDPGEVLDWVQQAMIDAAIQDEEDEETPPLPELAPAPPVVTAPAPAVELDPSEDYALRSEEAPLLDSDEAMEVLSLGGEIPEVLRKRLEKLKKKK